MLSDRVAPQAQAPAERQLLWCEALEWLLVGSDGASGGSAFFAVRRRQVDAQR